MDRAAETSSTRYRELFESHPVAMAVWDPATGRILAVNDAGLRQYGYEAAEIVDLPVTRLVHPDDLPRLEAAIPRFSSGVNGAAPFRHLRRDGTVIEVEVTGHEIEWNGVPARIVMALDVTERRQLEEQLRQAQKMEAIGRLAGGIAHDFNNLLTAIGGYTRLLIDSFEEGDPRREDAEQIESAAQRAAALTGQLLAFSRGGMVEPSRLDLNAVVRGVEPLLARLIGEHIEVRTSLLASNPWVTADRAQLEQVLVNLGANARDAMPDGGTLTISTEDVDAGTAWRQGLTAGAFVSLSVTDTGIGIAEEMREQVFEPFFTTKDPGKGTGLGLATVYATVRRAGGRIRLLSEPGHGSTFRILLPVAGEEAPDSAGPVDSDERVAAPAVILLAEDEDAVREFVARVLRNAGHTVLAAANGDQALELAAATAERIDLLVSDVVMPGVSGLQLAREMRGRRADLPVLLVSGYTEEQADAAEAGFDLLSKPFTADELLVRVQRTLAKVPPTT